MEQTTKHDVIAFCSSITEQLPNDIGKYFHFGVTSSDIIDTALSLQIKQSLDLILPELKNLMTSIKKIADQTKDIITIGRSHGMFAEPMSFGQKFLSYYCEFQRRLADLEDFYQNQLTGQFSGAVGNYTILNTSIEKEALNSLELKVEPISTQVIPRDRIAKLIGIHSLIGCSIERLAVEIRHLHRSDVNEIQEGFSKDQKGSSTMPHKKNPISCENLTGIARVLRSHQSIAHDNIILWHERDISHSSSERMYLPDNFGLIYYALRRMNSTIKNLVINKENIEQKVFQNFSYLSSYYLHLLIENTSLSRDELYPIIQKVFFKDSNITNLSAINKSIELELIELKISYKIPVLDKKQIKNLFLKETESLWNRIK